MKFRTSLTLALVAGLTSFAALQAQAQGGYVKLGGAYNMGIGGDIQYNSTTTRVSNNNGPSNYKETFERVDMNLGKGISAGGAFGYMFSENVGAELGINYLLGKKTELKSISSETTPTSSSNFTGSSEAYSRMLLIQPSVVIAAGGEGLKPYARIGVVAGKGTVYQNVERTHQNSSQWFTDKGETIAEMEFSGGWAFGLQGGLGVDFSISENIALFAELTFSNMKYSPDKGELTKLTLNGKDELSSLDKSEKEFVYVSDHEDNSANQPSRNEPTEEPKTNLPFGNAGFGLGLKFNF